MTQYQTIAVGGVTGRARKLDVSSGTCVVDIMAGVVVYVCVCVSVCMAVHIILNNLRHLTFLRINFLTVVV